MKPLFRTPIGHLGPVPGSEFHNDRHDHLHGGIDLNGPMGGIIVAPYSGIVTFVGLSSGLGGNKVEIDHGVLSDGQQHQTKHYHFGPKHSAWQDVIFVDQGQRVIKGQPLGLCGMSGNASAPHDHYEHYVNGRQQDPLCYLRDYQQIRRWLTQQRYGLFYPASESIDVLTAQWRLNQHGHFVIADGVYGPHSQTHMRAFQTSKGLEPDGIVGRLTWQALLKRPEL